MSDPVKKKSIPTLFVVLIGGAVLLGCLLTGLALALILLPGVRTASPTGPSSTLDVTPLVFPTATARQTQPTSTPPTVDQPTQPPADAPTATQPPTAQPTQPASTNPPPPTSPPPTNTPPPTATTSSATIDGLTNVRFWVDSATVAPNQRISFNFSVTNSGSQNITFGYMGVTVFKGGANVYFHTSWTQWVLAPGKTETWNDGLAIGDAGTYELKLSACLPHIDDCNAGKGKWYYLGDPVTVTVTGG